MNLTEEFELRGRQLAAAGKLLYDKGWLPATSGNLSARLSDGSIAITVSGSPKGRLTSDDLMRVSAKGASLDDRQPSAETGLHVALYARYPNAGAVLHPHSPAAVLASRLFEGSLVLEDHELLKALDSIKTHRHRLQVPIFANDQNIPRLAARVNDWIDQRGDILAYIIAGHGFYSWGPTVDAAVNAVEALEFMFECETRLFGVKPR